MKEYFMPENMSESGLKDFLNWYEARKKDPFDFQKELEEYCRYVIINFN